MDALMHTWCFYDLQVFDLIIYKFLIIRLPDYMYLYFRYYIYWSPIILFQTQQQVNTVQHSTKCNAQFSRPLRLHLLFQVLNVPHVFFTRPTLLGGEAVVSFNFQPLFQTWKHSPGLAHLVDHCIHLWQVEHALNALNSSLDFDIDMVVVKQ